MKMSLRIYTPQNKYQGGYFLYLAMAKKVLQKITIYGKVYQPNSWKLDYTYINQKAQSIRLNLLFLQPINSNLCLYILFVRKTEK